jgi:DNA invertase Pin-like site-specific DNA recombinase
MKKQAAIYARVSSERQKDQKTIASQTALLREYAQAHDYVVPEDWVFEDEGYSGSTLARPGLERLRDLAAEGLVETVLVYAPDRLSRNYAYQVLLIEEFGRGGAQTLFLKSAGGASPEERLLVQFQGMIAEYERARDCRTQPARQAPPGQKRLRQRAIRSALRLPLRAQDRDRRGLLRGDRVGSRRGSGGLRALYAPTLEHRRHRP